MLYYYNNIIIIVSATTPCPEKMEPLYACL